VTAGDGSAGNPWIIENWDINGTGVGYCLYIGNTTENFVVRNCSLHEASGAESWPFDDNTSVVLFNVNNGVLNNNTLFSNVDCGIRLYNSGLNYITNNNISESFQCIYLQSSTDNTISNNQVSSNKATSNGIRLIGCNNNTVSDNTASNLNNDGYAISLDNSDNNTVNNNIASDAENGIYVIFSSGNVISNNTAHSNDDYGIYLYFDSNNNKIIDNNVTMNNLTGILVYWESEYNVIESNSAYSNDHGGISVAHSDYNIVINNNASDNLQSGIVVSYGDLNTVEDNLAYNNEYNGIYAIFSNLNTITLNSVGQNPSEGIGVTGADNNTISGNTVFSNRYGLAFHSGSSNNTITGNSVLDNDDGVSIANCSDNQFYHNNFIANTVQAIDYDLPNTWNNGYPSGGNYWSDYSGDDELSGQSQDIQGSDGIGDVWNHISGGAGATDFYPLMNPAGTNDPYTPNSTVDQPAYWHNIPVELTATSNDNISGTKNVTLSYIFSPDNGSFGSWIEFSTDAEFPWNWTFDFPEGEGYYEFYSIATDAFNNTEATPITGQASCAYDITLPESEIFQLNTFWLNNRTIYLDWNASDGLSGLGPVNTSQSFPSHENVDLWMRFSGDNTTWGNWELADQNMVNGSIYNHKVLADGYYQFYSIAHDIANNTELAPLDGYDVFLGMDTVSPIAVAGDNQAISQYSRAIFDATNSTDTLGIVNYSWSFTYESQNLVVNQDKFNFTFNHYGNYLITLEVLDGAGNSAIDTLWINVSDDESPIADAGVDQQTDPNIWITFDGSGSTDNVGIMTYTWTFRYNGTTTTLDGMYPKFKFEEHGTYDVTLLVTDEAGNSDTDTMQVYVAEDITQSGSSYAWIIVLFVLVLIVAALGIMMFYFKKGSQTQLDERDRDEARSHRESQFDDDGYDDDDDRYR